MFVKYFLLQIILMASIVPLAFFKAFERMSGVEKNVLYSVND